LKKGIGRDANSGVRACINKAIAIQKMNNCSSLKKIDIEQYARKSVEEYKSPIIIKEKIKKCEMKRTLYKTQSLKIIKDNEKNIQESII